MLLKSPDLIERSINEHRDILKPRQLGGIFGRVMAFYLHGFRGSSLSSFLSPGRVNHIHPQLYTHECEFLKEKIAGNRDTLSNVRCLYLIERMIRNNKLSQFFTKQFRSPRSVSFIPDGSVDHRKTPVFSMAKD